MRNPFPPVNAPRAKLFPNIVESAEKTVEFHDAMGHTHARFPHPHHLKGHIKTL